MAGTRTDTVKTRHKPTMMIFSFVLFCTLTSVTWAVTYTLSGRSSEAVEDRVSYQTYLLNCQYMGPGLYKFSGPKSIKTIAIDRLYEEAHTRITSNSLEELHVMSGTTEICTYITASSSVRVIVANEICVCIFWFFF